MAPTKTGGLDFELLQAILRVTISGRLRAIIEELLQKQ